MKIFRENIVRTGALVLALPLALAGCSASKEPQRKFGPPFVQMQTKFDYSEHEPYAKSGKNEVSGQAIVTRQGNSVVTCAGNRVLLMPATSYFREMFWHMIVERSEPKPPENPNPSLKNMIRRTECDAQGHFSFSQVPDGTWFVLTQVNAKPGGLLITEMTLPNSDTPQVLLTDKHIVGP
jgi:hypothetical protein